MTDHHDFDFGHDDLHQFDDHHEELLPAFEEPQLDDPWDHHEDTPLPDEHVAEEAFTPVEHVETTDLPDLSEEPVEVFPPTLDVGDLPEPVDGFPWIDPAGLGPAAEVTHDDPVHPQELAAYAASDAETWAQLRESDDPATSALARWWSQQN